MCITAMRATKNLNTLNPASARIIGNLQVSLHLDHVSAPLLNLKLFRAVYLQKNRV
jgi:hypothetical protein